jgi:hypothetical protein
MSKLERPDSQDSDASADDSFAEQARIHSLIGNQRRLLLLRELTEVGDEATVRELSERLAAKETGTWPPPRSARKSVYVSLIQTHLPKLDRADVIAYDEGAKSVRLCSEICRLEPYLDAPEEDSDRPWPAYYAAAAGLGALVVFIATVGVPGVSAVPTVAWAFLGYLAVGAVATVQLLESK